MSWAWEEFKDLELGDARRTQRLIKFVDDLSTQPTGASRWPAGAGRRRYEIHVWNILPLLLGDGVTNLQHAPQA